MKSTIGRVVHCPECRTDNGHNDTCPKVSVDLAWSYGGIVLVISCLYMTYQIARWWFQRGFQP